MHWLDTLLQDMGQYPFVAMRLTIDDGFCRKCGAELKKEEIIIEAEEVTEADFEEIVEEAVEADEIAEEVVE